jgi:hypothetical protein
MSSVAERAARSTTCKYHSVATKDTTTVPFNVRLPKWTGLASTRWPCVGFVDYIKFTDKRFSGRHPIHFNLEFLLSQLTGRFPFRLLFENIVNLNMEEINNVFQEHFDECTEYFPSLRGVPRLQLVDARNEPQNQQMGVWKLTLPPDTSFCCSDKALLNALGFSDDQFYMTDLVFGGRGMPTNDNETVYIFDNLSSVNTMQVKAATPVPKGSVLAVEYADLMNIDLDLFFTKKGSARKEITADEDEPRPPRDLPFQVNVHPIYFNYDSTTDTGYIPQRKLTARALAACFKRAVENFEKTRNVRDQGLLEVKQSDQNIDVVEITSKSVGFAGLSNAVLSMTYDGTLMDYLEVQRQVTKDFDLNGSDSITFNVQASKQNPLADKYPVTVKQIGTGQARSYVDSFGYSDIFCIIQSVSGNTTSDGQVYIDDNQNINLMFYDDAMQLITFEGDYDVSLTIKFKI